MHLRPSWPLRPRCKCHARTGVPYTWTVMPCGVFLQFTVRPSWQCVPLVMSHAYSVHQCVTPGLACCVACLSHFTCCSLRTTELAVCALVVVRARTDCGTVCHAWVGTCRVACGVCLRMYYMTELAVWVPRHGLCVRCATYLVGVARAFDNNKQYSYTTSEH
jgi:hypothetical protein